MALLVVGLSGCRQEPAPLTDPETAEPVAAAPVPPVELQNPPDAAQYVSSDPVIEPQARDVSAQVASFEWTAEPTADSVPDSPVTGRIHGRPFLCKYASVAPDDEDLQPTYLLRFSNQPRGKLCGFSLDDDSVSLEWHLPTGVGEWSRKLSEPRPDGSYAWYTVRQADGTPFTRNADWACYLELTEQRGPTEEGGAASLTGRLALVFNDQEQSWIAGTFKADGCR